MAALDVSRKGHTRLERIALAAMREANEPYALTDATRSRSSSRLKSGPQRKAEAARALALCDALGAIGVDQTGTAAYLRLKGQVSDEITPPTMMVCEDRTRMPARDGFAPAGMEWRSINQHPTVSEPISEPHLSEEHAREWIELDDILGEAWVERRLVGAWERVGRSRLVVPGHNGPDRRVVRHRRSEPNVPQSEINPNRRKGPDRRTDD
jgi:hypothetical protein